MKWILILIIFCAALSLFSHEISFIYSALEEDPNSYLEQKGWQLNFAALRWGDNDFSDYAASILFTRYGSTLRADLDIAWLKIKLFEDSELFIGKQYYDFGAVAGSGSC